MLYPRPTRYVLVVAFALAITGCTAEAVSSLCGDAIVAGDLAISEILPNPDGSDGDGFREYVELYNASATSIDLTGFRLVASRADGDGEKSHVIGPLSIEAGQYLVLINAPEATMPEFASYSYGAALGSLRNSDGRVALTCGREIIDEAHYESSADGKAIELDGSSPPDSVRNDDVTSWCMSVQEIASMTGNYGTPGLPNMTCGAGGGASTCSEDGVSRPVVRPKAGDVSISEWMPNPKGADGDLEWVELRVNTAFDLNALQLGTAPDSLRSILDTRDCVSVAPSSYVVIAKSQIAAPVVDAVASFTLANSGDRSVVIGTSGTVLDQVSYARTVEGVSWHIDEEGVPCPSTEALEPPDEYSTENFGTPGSANALCVGEGQCIDQATQRPRPIVKPSVGQVMITEWISDAAGSDSGKEWIELFVSTSVDLNGLQVGGDELEDKVGNLACISANAGSYVVIGQAHDSAPVVDAVADFSLGNSGTHSVVVGIDDTIFDEVLYDGSKSGVSRQIDAQGVACASADTQIPPGTYDGENTGTPGAPNPLCGPAVGGEQCFDVSAQRNRSIVSPRAADVRITEWLANPAGTDTDKEWFEVRFSAAADLNGVVLSDSSAGKTTLSSSDCLEVAAGSHVVFAKNATPSENGGITNVFATFGFALNNSGTETISLTLDGNVLEQISYSGSTNGAATQIDGSGTRCDASSAYGDQTNLGSPGAVNPSCP